MGPVRANVPCAGHINRCAVFRRRRRMAAICIIPGGQDYGWIRHIFRRRVFKHKNMDKRVIAYNLYNFNIVVPSSFYEYYTTPILFFIPPVPFEGNYFPRLSVPVLLNEEFAATDSSSKRFK